MEQKTRLNKSNTLRVAVVGATGNVGRQVLKILAERLFPVHQVFALGSSQSKGKSVSFGDVDLPVHPTDSFNFSGIDLVFSAVSPDLAQHIVPQALQAGAVVIDKSSAFRMEAHVPLVVPEINNDLLSPQPSLIANPNCVVIPLVMALFPLHQINPLKRVVISTYQSVSGAGHQGMAALFNQTRSILVNDSLEDKKSAFAFNVIPSIGALHTNGMTDEEEKVMQETQKILGWSGPVSVTCVRVPVFIGHCVAVHVEFQEEMPLSQAQQALKNMSGVRLETRHKTSLSPLNCVGEDEVFVSRLRQTTPTDLMFWVTCDNLRKGAALNAVQIAEHLFV